MRTIAAAPARLPATGRSAAGHTATISTSAAAPESGLGPDTGQRRA